MAPASIPTESLPPVTWNYLERYKQPIRTDHAKEHIAQRRSRGFRRVSMPPCTTHQSPANLKMCTDWMLGPRRYDTSVTEESTFRAFDGPAVEAVLTVGHCVGVKLRVAFLSTDTPSVVVHHRGISVHAGKRISVSILPGTKAQTRRDNDHSNTMHGRSQR